MFRKFKCTGIFANAVLFTFELLMLKGSHGFMKTHKWHDMIGAFINVEASGTGGPGKCDVKFLL